MENAERSETKSFDLHDRPFKGVMICDYLTEKVSVLIDKHYWHEMSRVSVSIDQLQLLNVDELVLKLQADISDLEKKLNKLDADAEKRGKSLGEKLFAGIKSVAAPLAGLFAGAKITEFFSTAIKNAQKFEQSMLKAESAAKAFGQSVRATKSEVQDLI